eukprot:SAG22_NODE_872_length_6726_cov_2.255923_6_plen_285_part_00
MIDEILHIFIMPLVRPDWWRDKMGGRPLLIWLPMLGCPLVGSYLRWWYNGTPYVFTIMVVGSFWWSLFGCVATAASGALMMDCLPADERGQPKAAARDLNLHEWARRIPETGFPLLLATSMTWFPSHLAAFNWYFLIGGTISNVAWLMFITTIHPRDEPLDKDWQHLRYYFCPHYREYDDRRRCGVAGPELLAAELAAQQKQEAVAAAAAARGGGPADAFPEAGGGAAAKLCDSLCFAAAKRQPPGGRAAKRHDSEVGAETEPSRAPAAGAAAEDLVAAPLLAT